MITPKLNIRGLKNASLMDDFKHKKEFPYDGIYVWTGSQGAGKTLCMMHFVRALYEEFPDIMIVSNISIFGLPCVPYTGVKDFTKYNNGEKGIVFIIDEIQTLFSSLQSANMPESQISVWSQNRKNRRCIFGTSQRFGRIAKPIREQTRYNIECRRSFFHVFPYRIYDGDCYDENGVYQDETPSLHFYVPRMDVMTMYNTLEVVRKENYKNDETNI